MVDRSATRWGVRQGGRCVWFEFERNGRSAKPQPARAASSARAVELEGDGLHVRLQIGDQLAHAG